MGDEPEPSFTKTYKRADGEMVDGEYSWTTDFDTIGESDFGYPVEVIEETWERTSVRRFWHLPDEVCWCEIALTPSGSEQCEEDAVGWRHMPDGAWHQVCADHRAPSDPSVCEGATPPVMEGDG